MGKVNACDGEQRKDVSVGRASANLRVEQQWWHSLARMVCACLLVCLEPRLQAARTPQLADTAESVSGLGIDFPKFVVLSK